MRIRAGSFILALALALALALGFASVSVQAIPILWTLDSVTFADDGTASGSFVYDRDTDAFSMINVTTTTVGVFGASYSFDHPSAGSNFPLFLSGLGSGGDLTGETIAAFFLSAAMTNAGGTIALNISNSTFEGTCDATCLAGFVPFRFIDGGSIIGVAVPEPSTLGLLGAGLLGLFMRRKRVA